MTERERERERKRERERERERERDREREGGGGEREREREREGERKRERERERERERQRERDRERERGQGAKRESEQCRSGRQEETEGGYGQISRLRKSKFMTGIQMEPNNYNRKKGHTQKKHVAKTEREEQPGRRKAGEKGNRTSKHKTFNKKKKLLTFPFREDKSSLPITRTSPVLWSLE